MSSTALATGPTVTLSPTGNHPKGTTAVSGSGFAANEPVDIYFDTTDEILVAANGSGNFGPDTLTVPANAQPGSHWITAIGRRSITAAQHAFLVRTRWNSHGFNERGRRDNPFENTIDPGNAGNLDVAWSALTGNDIFSSPAVAQIASTYGPYVFVGSGDHKLYAFDSTGAVKWTASTGGAILSSPAISSTTVYVGSEDGKLYAFKAANGAAAWASPASVGGAIDSSPAVANGIVYVGAEDGKVYTFHASDGTPAWPIVPVTGAAISESSPAVADGMAYIGSGDGKMYAYDAATGASGWPLPFPTGGAIVSSPAVAGGVVYFGSTDSKIYAVNAKSGAQKWSVTTGDEILSSAAVSNGVVYIGSQDEKLYALRASNGDILWTGTLPAGAGYSGIAVANGVVYLGTDGRDVEAFNANGCGTATCSPLWTGTTGEVVNSSPAISDGMLYFGSNDNRFYAYALDAGNNAAYRFRKSTPPPSYTTLHPDMRLKPVRH